MPIEQINGRYWGITKFMLVVKQTAKGMEVVSTHHTRKDALNKVATLGNDAIYAVVGIIGNPRKNYKPGNLLNKDDVDWRMGAENVDRCSECLQQYIPDSLEYKCPIDKVTLCDVVKHHRAN